MITRVDRNGNFICPVCTYGVMCEHDQGYDECSICDFYVIYDDGRNPATWTRKELLKIYTDAASNWSVCNAWKE